MGKHTPGPWAWRGEPGEAELDGATGCVLSHAAYEGMWLSYEASEDRRQANGRLIAAAPELLEALIGCIEHMEYSTPQGKAAYETARAAIAKAAGESP